MTDWALTPIVMELNAVLRRCESIEPGSTSDLDIVMLLATLRWPPLPPLFAPTERSDELVTAGAGIAATGPQSLEELITLVVDQLSERWRRGRKLGEFNVLIVA